MIQRHYPFCVARGRLGFTLIELIVVIAIISIVAAATFVAIDPARRLQTSRNSTRWTDVRSLLEAVKKYQADNAGNLPSTSSAIDSDAASVQLIGESVSGGTPTCTGVIVSSGLPYVSGLDTDLAEYIADIPEDPKTGNDSDTRYYINVDTKGILSVGSCDEEGEAAGGGGTPPTIVVKR